MTIREHYQRLEHLLRRRDLHDLPWWQRRGVFLLRMAVAVGEDVSRGQLTLRAMSLVYTTLLSMVPLLAVSFSVLKAFDVHNQIRPALARFLAPLGARGAEITNQIVGFVENIKVGVLGALGLALLFYTVVGLMQKIEQAFNEVWRIHHIRPLARRFSDYLSVLLIGPVLVFSAIGITASVFSSAWVQRLSAVEPFGFVIDAVAALVPYLLIILAFTFLYIFIPNTRVKPLSAFTGALVAGVLWQSGGWLFASLVAGSARYTAIYSAFAALILFMIWLYLSWLILLLGTSIAYYHQHPQQLVLRDENTRLSPRLRERLALAIMAVVVQAYYDRKPAPDPDGLADRLGLPLDAINESLRALVVAGLLRVLDNDGEIATYHPGTPPESTPLGEVLAAVRAYGEQPGLDVAALRAPAAATAVADAWDSEIADAMNGRTVRDLIRTAAP